MQNTKELFRKLIIPLTFPLLLWVIYLVTYLLDIPAYKLGILPRNISGLVGIFTSPLIHGGFSHLISNSAPLIFMGLGIFYFYPKVAYKVFTIIYLGTGILVWIFAREVYHIGASGIIYGFVSFLFFSGIFRKDNRSIALALVVIFLYGGLIWGVLPVEKGVSWESHLSGAIVGIIASFIFRKVDPPKKYDWEEEESGIPANKLEVSYDADKNDF
ncbi:MAG: rhomboid family intramembrane serine protease [Ignavibacteriales bacterium]|nr:rhomboid family intramembrane serine protease [Ignavibacteriales bacterium]